MLTTSASIGLQGYQRLPSAGVLPSAPAWQDFVLSCCGQAWLVRIALHLSASWAELCCCGRAAWDSEQQNLRAAAAAGSSAKLGQKTGDYLQAHTMI